MTRVVGLARTTIYVLILLVPLAACRGGAERQAAEGPEAAPAGPAVGPHAADSTRLRTVYDQIGQHYPQMMLRYEGMTDEMTPEMRQLYEQMRQHYQEQMPADMMGPGMTGRHMMAMHDRGAWSKQMLDLHERMAQLHAQNGSDGMAEMHERMVDLYRDALQNMPSGDSEH